MNNSDSITDQSLRELSISNLRTAIKSCPASLDTLLEAQLWIALHCNDDKLYEIIEALSISLRADLLSASRVVPDDKKEE